MKIRDSITRAAKRSIAWLEDPSIPFFYVILTFFFSITLRNFLETYFTGEIQEEYFISTLIHYYISYVALAMAVVILFHYAIREPVLKVSRLILPFFLLLVLNPVLSLAVPPWRTFSTGYAFPDQHPDLLWRFITFFGSLTPSGATPAMRIEIALALMLGFMVVYWKTRQIVKSLLTALLLYTIIFAYGAIPFIFDAFMRALNLKAELLLPPMTNFYFLLIFFFGAWLAFLWNPKYFLEIIKDMRGARLMRLVHYELMFVFGIIIAETMYHVSWKLTADNIFPLLFNMFAIFFACLFSLITNNCADRSIDFIANPDRPSVTRSIPPDIYKNMGWAALFLAIVYASLAGVISCLIILLFMGNYFLYSMPPVRLKRVPLISKVLISLNCLALILLGFHFHSHEFEVPIPIIGYYLIWITAVMNFIDIKDYEGDKTAGIKTLPTLLGLEKSKRVIGILFILAYTQASWAFERPDLLSVLLVIGSFQFYFINRKKFDEKPIFAIYLLSLLGLMYLLRQSAF